MNKKYKGIKITYKNGEIDWYDPCTQIIIDNGEHEYKIEVDDIKKIETYELEIEQR